MEDRSYGRPRSKEEIGKALIMEDLRMQLIESKLRRETIKVFLKGFIGAFIVFVVLVLVAMLSGLVG